MKRFLISTLLTSFLFTSQLFPALAQHSQEKPQQTMQNSLVEVSQAFQGVLATAQRIGNGAMAAYNLDGNTLFVLSQKHFGKLILWYAEAVSLPTEAVSSHF